MCDTLNNHSHEHGVRSDVEKALGDLRDNLSEKLKVITKYEAQIALISKSDFPEADEVIHLLEHILSDEKRHTAELIKLILELDEGQAEFFEEDSEPHEHHEHHH